MALGASTAAVLRLMLGHAVRLVLMGIGAGLLAAAFLARLLGRLLFNVEPLDPWTFAATALTLLVVATAASYLPARRGTRMAPVDALRTS
jgi:ABC-type antimicrobial peptide transport system permease subunit